MISQKDIKIVHLITCAENIFQRNYKLNHFLLSHSLSNNLSKFIIQILTRREEREREEGEARGGGEREEGGGNM